jgi:hypothetical protein
MQIQPPKGGNPMGTSPDDDEAQLADVTRAAGADEDVDIENEDIEGEEGGEDDLDEDENQPLP